ncbi:hypothetical protein BT96DRAFT_21501 [Gymnopus androsaceus JB14]|uniref:Uncharacterized protein n=1 Tax=Gymnopus androsaceus JB14 TaxID=1447944 RepID=A0A6A4IBS9_9AGAR|nr:hypothetical protein BT96DRAFT_21501 [Gymnopus androsaceus JB14]
MRILIFLPRNLFTSSTIRPLRKPIFDDDDDEDDDMDFNNLDKEEDRTVTARSRRAISRVNETPPPPVPPIPFSFLTTTNSREQPFPRSPTASVFSVPTSGRDSVAYSYTSTSHLRPTISRSSITGFANLPPSPPIHKERERRRLRKKSRPQDPATMEMHTRAAYNYPGAFTMNSSQESIRESDGELEPRPVTPRRSPSPAATPDPAVTMSPPRNNRNSVSSSSGLPSPPSRTPLLSRIGSVKKWGVRKKRASSTPSETILQEAERQAETEQQENRTRPPSAAGLPAPSTPSSKPWFFRATSGSGAVNTPAQKFEVNDHQTPKASARTAKKSDLPPFDTPSKLVKRKSLGFVPLRPRNGPVNDDVEDLPPPPPSRNSTLGSTSDLPSDLEAELGLDSDVAAGRSPSKKKKKNRQSLANPPPQQPRHGSYGGIGLGRAPDARRSTEDFESRRNTPRSSSRSKSRDRRAEKESANRDESEGSRNFMGSVRRISFVGKHKRTKSGVSLSSVAEGLKKSLDRRRETSDDAMDVDDNQPPPPSGSGLLPPIELSPPSPPHIASGSTIGLTAHEDSLDLDALPPPPSSSSSSNFSSPSLLLKSSTGTVKPPLTASLGRSTIVPVMIASSSMPASSSNVPRRNSLGDLKIPARISQAQVGLRRDLGMVKEFATNVEQLKNLQTIYHNLVVEMQSILDAHAHQVSSRAASPIFRPLSRMRSNTSGAAPSPTHDSYKHLAAAFYTINSKYKIAWECAELLIELGGGSSETAPNSPPSTSISAPTMMAAAISSNQSKKSRERAITLSGEQSKPGTPTPGSYASDSSSPPLVNAPNMAWRASTGRHDLNQRQLLLLREMLNNSNSSFVTENTQSPIVEDPPTAVNREWRWGGDGMNSTITLPSEESSTVPSADAGKKRRSSRLKGMRDMLRSLTKNQAANTSPVPPSTTSLSTESSKDSQHRYPHDKVPTYGRRRAKTSSGPDAASSVRERDRDVRSKSPYTATSLSVKASPRRPSLASIFRIGGKSKPSPTPSAMGSSRWHLNRQCQCSHSGE